MTVFPAFGRLKEKDGEFKAILGYRVSSSPAWSAQ
jgi:hypothetical protein